MEGRSNKRIRVMASQSDDDDLVNKVLLGFTTLLSEMVSFYETDVSRPQQQKRVWTFPNPYKFSMMITY